MISMMIGIKNREVKMTKATGQPRGRRKGSGGWQQLSVRMAEEWSKACGLLPERHNTSLSELLADAIAEEPLKAVQVLSGYIPRNIDVTLNAEGTLAEALGRASQLMIEADAKVIDDQVIDIKEETLEPILIQAE
jgi:hypothetical protein